MDNLPVVVFGLAIFLVPAALLFWSTSTKSGREGYERKLRESAAWAKTGELPLKPPRSGLSRWACRHPWWAAALIGLAESAGYYAFGRLVLDDGHGETVTRALWFGVEGFVVTALTLREFWKRYGKSAKEPAS